MSSGKFLLFSIRGKTHCKPRTPCESHRFHHLISSYSKNHAVLKSFDVDFYFAQFLQIHTHTRGPELFNIEILRIQTARIAPAYYSPLRIQNHTIQNDILFYGLTLRRGNFATEVRRTLARFIVSVLFHLITGFTQYDPIMLGQLLIPRYLELFYSHIGPYNDEFSIFGESNIRKSLPVRTFRAQTDHRKIPTRPYRPATERNPNYPYRLARHT